MKKVLLTTVMSFMMCIGVFAQDLPDYRKAPKPNEKVIATKTATVDCKGGWCSSDLITKLLELAINEYPTKKNIAIRELEGQDIQNFGEGFYRTSCSYKLVGETDITMETYASLSQALNKALRNVREGSRMAIDQVSVTYGMDKETLKDQLLDVLLDKGYKVIAKEYLEKLYEEQEAQQSGIYNENTTVKDNNFSAVGYYINVKVTETSLRVQVVNVSTGEYEGNATVNF